MDMRQTISGIRTNVARAIVRARIPIWLVGGAYAGSILTGIVMVHAGNTFALNTRDQIVNRAAQQDRAMQAADQGYALSAALWDFAGNLALGAVPKTQRIAIGEIRMLQRNSGAFRIVDALVDRKRGALAGLRHFA